jgi:Tfp pilus assembly protein PilF
MAKSPSHVDNKPLSSAEEVHSQLDELEAKIGRLGYGLGQEALTILSLFDTVTEGLVAFQAEGHSMRAEEARLKTAAADLKRKAKVFLREVGGPETLKEARRSHQPDPTHWWWYPDKLVADERRARLRKILLVVVGVVAALLLLVVLYELLLAPDPATRERLKLQQNAESLAISGDLIAALGEVEQALVIAPDNPDLLLLKAGLQQSLGQNAEAEETFAAAESVLGNRENFLLARGRTYLLLGQAQEALADAQEAVALNPESAPGYMLVGRSHQLLENYMDAIFAYEQASTLAEMQGNSRLAATARVNLGFLLQQQRAQ